MSERGIKKWLSYKSLSEQEKYLNEMLESKARIEKPAITEDKAAEINELLLSYSGEEVCLYFYSRGRVRESRGEIDKIDPIYRIIEMNNIRIPFSSIVGLTQR